MGKHAQKKPDKEIAKKNATKTQVFLQLMALDLSASTKLPFDDKTIKAVKLETKMSKNRAQIMYYVDL